MSRTIFFNTSAAGTLALCACSVLAATTGCTSQSVKEAQKRVSDSVVIDKNERSPFNGGVFQGWGGSFCWWANRVGYSDTLAEETARLFYSLDDNGLGLNIIRYNIGGGDNPAHHHITRTDSAVPGYLNEDGSYDWTSDANQRNCLLRAVQKAGDSVIVEAFSNSAPWFMTISGCSSGNVNASMNNLKDDQYEAFADYLATVSKEYRTRWNISFQSLSPMNEPNTNYWGALSPKQEGCHFDPGESQSRMIIETRRALDRQGLQDILVCGSDETSTATAATSLKALSAEALSALGRVDTHSYNYPQTNGDISYKDIKEAALQAEKTLWMSEVDKGGTAGDEAGEMGAALELANRIICDMNGLTPAAWCIWDIIDTHLSKDSYNGNQDWGNINPNGGYWGVATADHDNQTVIIRKKFYGWAQFTRYIRPGYQQLPIKKDNVLAFLQPQEKKLVVVAVNTKAKEKTVSLDFTTFAKKPTLKQVIRTSGSLQDGENLATVPADCIQSGKIFYPTLKENSITTFIFDCGK